VVEPGLFFISMSNAKWRNFGRKVDVFSYERWIQLDHLYLDFLNLNVKMMWTVVICHHDSSMSNV
jgi:hypothetical protein